MTDNIIGKVIVITGASSGMGEAAARYRKLAIFKLFTEPFEQFRLERRYSSTRGFFMRSMVNSIFISTLRTENCIFTQ